MPTDCPPQSGTPTVPPGTLKCDGKITGLKLKWKGNETIEVSNQEINGTTAPVMVKPGEEIDITNISGENTQELTISGTDKKSCFHISCSDDNVRHLHWNG